MKRKSNNSKLIINGFYIQELIMGFMGERQEGKIMLRKMGLDANSVPFSVAAFLRRQKTFWKDSDGKVASVHFTLKPNQIECFGSYLGKKKSIRVFREWSSCDDPKKIAVLESEAIGDLCMRCIYEPLIE